MSRSNMFIGKDILRLLTTAMYNNPMVVYREYIQNAVDAMDGLTKKGLDKEQAIIRISLGHGQRNIVIRDGGSGISAEKFIESMTSVGWSEKKNTSLRGLWGIGRLVGLPYCQNLVFRTKAEKESVISCASWDGRMYKKILLNEDGRMDIFDAMSRVVEFKTEDAKSSDPSFFEVQMNGVIRHGNDILFNKEKVHSYISEVAPVPFHPDMPFREKLTEFLGRHVDVSGFSVFLNDSPDPIFRPHRKNFTIAANRKDNFSSIDCFEIKTKKENPTALGWVLHHSYLGALKNNPSIRGFRVRSGNMQIGDEHILSRIFPEERFNGWTVGELHIIDSTITPSGQRNDFEDTSDFRDIVNQLVPIVGRSIARKCRINSSERNKQRSLIKRLEQIEEELKTMEKNILSKEKKNSVITGIEEELSLLKSDEKVNELLKRLYKLRKSNKKSPFSNLSKNQQKLMNNLFDRIYDDCIDAKIPSEVITQWINYVKQEKKNR